MERRLFSLGLTLLFICGAWSIASAARRRPRPDEIGALAPLRTQSFDFGARADANQVSMVVTNFGSFAWDLQTGNSGLEFPKGSGLTAVFAGGLWLGARVGSDTRVAVAEYAQEYLPGAMVFGHHDDPADPKYRVFKLNRVYASAAERDAALASYNQDAVPSGAPPVSILGDGTLSITGDQMLWCVFNDADPFSHYASAGHTLPLGVEVQQTVFAFDRPGPLGRTVFIRYKIINKGQNLLEGMKIGLWMDPDIGNATDDLVGCVPEHHLGFGYNAGADGLYGANVPAVGVDLIQGTQLPEGGRTGLSAFTSYINGTDPMSGFETYNMLSGLLPDGQEIQNPVTGTPTTFTYSGDPLTGKGWLDSTPSDKRMLLSTDAFTLSPNEEQEVLYAVILAREGSHLGSLAQLECDQTGIDAFAAAGFTGPEPVTTPCPPPPSCPLSADEWEQLFNGEDGAVLPLTLLAQTIDESSLFLAFQAPLDEVRALLNSSNQSSPAGNATREYVALLANACAARLGLPVQAPLVFPPEQPVSCPGVEATNVRELLERAFNAVEGEYNNVGPNLIALSGLDWGGTGFGGGAGAMFDFLGNGPDPFQEPEAFPNVEVRFNQYNSQMAYRYLRLETSDESAPGGGREYRYGGFRSVPFTVWDVTHGVQLDVAFVERAVTDFDGTILSPGEQLATFDSTWAPSSDDFGGREYLVVVNRPYTGSPAFDLAQDGALLSVGNTFTYVLWSKLSLPDSFIDDGDAFLFAFGFKLSPGVDTKLLQLAALPQDDPDVLAAYADLSQCLRGVTGELGCCNDHQAPSLSVALSPSLLFPPSHALRTIHATVVAQDLCDPSPQFRLVSITSDEPDQGTTSDDVPNDIQGAAVGTADLEFQLRAERDDDGDGRTYTVCYEAVDASGNVAQQCATVTVPHNRRGQARLSAGQTWKLTVYGSPTLSARAVQAGSVVVATPSIQVGATAAAPLYADVDKDRVEDATFSLAPGLTAVEVASGAAITARWTAAGQSYEASIAPTGVTGVADLPVAFAIGASPNPSRREASIHYALPREGRVRIRVFDVTGRQVASLVDGQVPAGRHMVSFRPRVPQLYLYRVEWEGKSLTGRLTVLR